MASSRTVLRARRGPILSVLPADPDRPAGSLTGLLIDGRLAALQIGDRLLDATLERTIEGANTVTLDVWDGDRRAMSTEILGARVMTRTAQITLDGLGYTIAGDSRSGDTLSLTCEDAVITLLKRHGRGHPITAVRGRFTRVGFCAFLIRQAGIPVLVLDEDVAQPIKGARKLKRELEKARRQQHSQRTRNGRADVIGDAPDGLTVKGKPASKHQRRNISRVVTAAQAVRGATPRAVLAAVLAPIGEATYETGAAETTYGTHKGLYQSNQIPADQVEEQVKYFMLGGRSFQAGGAIAAARTNPGWSPGQIVTAVEASGQPGGFYERGSDGVDYLAEAKAMLGTTAGDGATDGHAWIKQYTYGRLKNESTYTCVRRLLDEVRWRVFIREGVAVIASEPALARGLPALVLGDELLDGDDYERHRGLRAGEATLKAYVGRYDADPGETLELPTIPAMQDRRWLIATTRVKLLTDVTPVEIQARLPLDPLKEPSSSVETTSPTDQAARSGAGGSLRREAERISDAGGSYDLGGGHGPLLRDVRPGQNLDCSSSCSLALYRAGLFGDREHAIVSGEFAASYGQPGHGREFTVFANAGHVFIQGDGWRFDTGGPGGGHGPRVHPETRPTAGFTPRRHPNH